ncbi:MAG: hypothetical protein R3A52_27715 [Polyangiales bacterium]
MSKRFPHTDARRRLALLWAATLTLSSGATCAQSVDDLLREGLARRPAGAAAAALNRFEAAWAISQSPRVAAQLGLTHQALGHWVEADRFLRLALADESDPWVRRNLAQLNGALQVVRTRVGEIDLVGAPAGAEVVVDGFVRGTLPLDAPLRVPTGTVTVEVRAAGHVSTVRRLVVEPAASLREEISLAPEPPPPPPPPTPPPAPVVTAPEPAPAPLPAPRPAPRAQTTRSAATRTLGVTLLASGGAAVLFGVVAAVLRETTAADYNDRCPAPSPSLSPECTDLLDAESAWGAARWVGVSAGVALMAGGVAALMLGSSTGRHRAWACGVGLRSASCEVRF